MVGVVSGWVGGRGKERRRTLRVNAADSEQYLTKTSGENCRYPVGAISFTTQVSAARPACQHFMRH